MKTAAGLLCLAFLFASTVRADDPNDLWYRGFLKNEAAKEMIEDDRLLERIELRQASRNAGSPAENSKSPGVAELEEELKALKKRLRELRERKKELDQEILDMKGNFDFGAAPRIEAPELPSFHSRLSDEEKRLFSTPDGMGELFPEGSITQIDPESGGEITTELRDPPSFPQNWIPRKVDGEWTFIIPLIETDETRSFSKVIPAPATQPLSK